MWQNYRHPLHYSTAFDSKTALSFLLWHFIRLKDSEQDIWDGFSLQNISRSSRILGLLFYTLLFSSHANPSVLQFTDFYYSSLLKPLFSMANFFAWFFQNSIVIIIIIIDCIIKKKKIQLAVWCKKYFGAFSALPRGGKEGHKWKHWFKTPLRFYRNRSRSAAESCGKLDSVLRLLLKEKGKFLIKG